MSDLIGVTPQEVAGKACDLNISGRVESLVALALWAQSQIASAAGVPVEMKAPAFEVAECECRKCLEGKTVKIGGHDWPILASRMVVCATCGNKRCPKANDHRNECTRSNEPGQSGSAYA
ncbi:hypothetical protein B0G84_2350 [Paraburkholderia sp. BL8N3]|nr:hypothetical protein [Paraburkholderia sp. BL8N3]TCK44002.1 hypothetical protein B0G84_2350 [Paraburkholderia sp. BL8N3]